MSASSGTDEPLRRQDVPWYDNGTVMKYVFIFAGISILYGAFFDPEFRDGRPGIIDVLIGTATGMIGGWFMGRRKAREAEGFARRRLTFWQRRFNRSLYVSQMVFAASFFPSLLLAASISHWLSHLLSLGMPWFGPGEPVRAGASIVAMVAYWVTAAVIVERWFRSLPE